MPSVIELLFAREWWTYESTASRPSQLYHWFNLLEGTAWLVIAAMVLQRHFRHRNSRLEILYGLAFALFGLSDFQEAFQLQSWLILAKGMILSVILLLRRRILLRYYPGTKSF